MLGDGLREQLEQYLPGKRLLNNDGVTRRLIRNAANSLMSKITGNHQIDQDSSAPTHDVRPAALAPNHDVSSRAEQGTFIGMCLIV